MDADGGNQVTLAAAGPTVPGCREEPPAWSPDGSALLYRSTAATCDGRADLYIVPTDASAAAARLLPEDDVDSRSATWSPDGTRIAFVGGQLTGIPGVYVVDVGTGALAGGLRARRITGPGDGLTWTSPRWSPDGTEIAVAVGTDAGCISAGVGSLDVVIVSADGSGQRPLVKTKAKEYRPTWSPDGRKLAFLRLVEPGDRVLGRPRTAATFVIDAEGTDERRLDGVGDAGSGEDQPPTWSPDGTRLLRLAVTQRDGGEHFDIQVVTDDGSTPVVTLEDAGTAAWRPAAARGPESVTGVADKFSRPFEYTIPAGTVVTTASGEMYAFTQGSTDTYPGFGYEDVRGVRGVTVSIGLPASTHPAGSGRSRLRLRPEAFFEDLLGNPSLSIGPVAPATLGGLAARRADVHGVEGWKDAYPDLHMAGDASVALNFPGTLNVAEIEGGSLVAHVWAATDEELAAWQPIAASSWSRSGSSSRRPTRADIAPRSRWWRPSSVSSASVRARAPRGQADVPRVTSKHAMHLPHVPGPPPMAAATIRGFPSPRRRDRHRIRTITGTPVARMRPSCHGGPMVSLAESDVAHLIHPLTAHRAHAARGPLVIVEGDGAEIVLEDGRRLIDGSAGLWCVNVGHGRTELAAAIADQAQRIAFAATFAGFASPPAIHLAERIAALLPGDLNAVMFTSGGSEANESAFKLARYHWRILGQPQRTVVLAHQRAYHGLSTAATAATGLGQYHADFAPLAPDFLHFPDPYPYRNLPENLDGRSAAQHFAAGAVSAIEAVGAERVAAIIAEPVLGTGGVIVPPAGYLAELRRVCDRFGILLIADEVITGFGRTGTWFGVERDGVVPDLLTFAKGVTSGYIPLGGVAVGSRVWDMLHHIEDDRPLMHGFTYSGHPVACAAGLANIDILEREGLVDRVAALAPVLAEALAPLAELPEVGEVRSIGLMAGIELVKDRATRERFPAGERRAARVVAAARDAGLSARSLLDDIVMLSPPFVITEDQIRRSAVALRDAIGSNR